MKPNHSFVILFLIFSIISCKRSSEPEYLIGTIYFNSFESSQDTVGWFGIYENSIVEEAPESGGKKSLRVSGGCSSPHAYYEMDPLQEDCNVVLKCWGKNQSNGGSISLQNISKSSSIHISITEMTWTDYTGNDTLSCNKGDTLEINLISGGFIPSSMLVDLIQITKVDSGY